MFTDVWNAFTDVWNVFTEVWNVFTEVWNVFTEVWNVFTEVWNVFTEVWNVFTEAWKAWNLLDGTQIYVSRNFGSVTRQIIKLVSRGLPEELLFSWSQQADVLPVEYNSISYYNQRLISLFSYPSSCLIRILSGNHIPPYQYTKEDYVSCLL